MPWVSLRCSLSAPPSHRILKKLKNWRDWASTLSARTISFRPWRWIDVAGSEFRGILQHNVDMMIALAEKHVAVHLFTTKLKARQIAGTCCHCDVFCCSCHGSTRPHSSVTREIMRRTS